MVVDVDAVPVPVSAPEGKTGPARSRSRRDLLRGLFGTAAGLALVPVVAASWPPDPEGDLPGIGFDEMYRGRHIQGVLAPSARAAVGGGAHWQVTVDGRPLHLMRRADGTWLSMVDHYRSYDTPLEAARAAVDELGPGEKLRETGPDHGHHLGGGHGLYA
ncbi:tyrosinase cofactor [Streptomyces sp. NPDC002588]|uniref:tyrosinase cofactor n=1 Tax=Streptomyces sp. NPDC002588 TaxID=3154419 RepID=UPI003317CC07